LNEVANSEFEYAVTWESGNSCYYFRDRTYNSGSVTVINKLGAASTGKCSERLAVACCK
jgi:hypothetical protein